MGKFRYRMPWGINKPTTECTIDVERYATKEGTENQATVKSCLWDTGATVTVISELLVHRLGLIPTDFMKVSGYDGRPQMRNVYKIDVVINDEIRFNRINAIDAPLITTDMLLGMDIIGEGDFHLTHEEDSLVLSFNNI